MNYCLNASPERLILRIAFLVVAAILPIQSETALGTGSESIRFWAVANSVDDVELYRDLASDFEKSTGTKVEVTPLGWGDSSQKYFTAMAAGVAPDVGIASFTSPMEWGSVGGLVAFDKDFPDETKKIQDALLPGMLEQFKFRDSLYGLPTDLVTKLVYYRPDIFQRLGLKAPTTWSDLTNAIQKIEKNNYRFYMGWTKSEQWALSYYYMPFGFVGPQIKDGKPYLEWRDSQYQNAIQFALELWYTHSELGLLPSDREVARFLSDIPNESTPLMIEGNWLAPMVNESAKKIGTSWAVAPWPKADAGEPNNLMGGTAYVIFKSSPHKKSAMNWLTYLYSSEVQQKMLLSRASRTGQTANFNISPIKSMWLNEQDPFWTQRAFAPYKQLVSALTQIAWTFKSVQKPLGLKEVNHLEDQALDRMRTFILDHMEQKSREHNLSIWEYIKETARGKFKKERLALKKSITKQLKVEYEAIYDQAISQMEHESNSYQERFGSALMAGKDHQSKIDILRLLEWAAAIIIIGFFLIISLRRDLREHLPAYIMIAAPLGLTVIFVVIPMLTALYLSMTEYHAILPLHAAKWVGIKHYITSFQWSDSDNVLLSLRRTLLYIGVSMPLGVGLALIFAFLLNHKLTGQRLWRFLYFSPLVTSSVAVALIFTQIYSESESGWLNAILLKLGIIENPLLLIHDKESFLYCVIGLAVWHGLAFTILIFLAGLQQIPEVLYRAAEVDGAGFWRKFWHISLPGLRPQIIFVVMMGLIGGFQVFEPIYMMGGGSGYVGSKFGPNDAGKTMVPLVFDLGFERFKMGQASAVAYILFGIIFGITLMQLKLLQRHGKGDL
jgi:ABC-type sugar transport system permease subunit/ABC-type glycerol-3-phosphate transport system substrate-binding protein